MTDETTRKQEELDRLLNDPTVPMHAARVWDLLDEIAAPARGHSAVIAASASVTWALHARHNR